MTLMEFLPLRKQHIGQSNRMILSIYQVSFVLKTYYTNYFERV
jgi:hypothetical protein